MESRNEITVTKERLHWGVFTPVAVVAFALSVLTLPVLFLLNGLNHALKELNPHGASNVPLMFMLLVPDFLIVAVVLAVVWAAYGSCEITLTNRRIVFRTGLITRHSGELPLENAESVFVSEGALGRLLGFGTVTVTSVGGQSLPFQFLRNPQRFSNLLKEAIAAAKRPSAVVTTAPPADDSRYMPKR
jgi:uncharacterized membrane protein YdbT with pleckstrin-like domain